MGIAVYPRLGQLLEANRMTVAELERQIESRFGMSVDSKTLYRLTHADAVQRADLEIAGAAAAVLGVGLDDVFDVRVVRVDSNESAPTGALGDLAPEQSRRLSELFDRQSRGELTEDERREMEGLVKEWGSRQHEYRLRHIAALRGVTVEEARAQIAAEFEKALEWWREFEADPRRRRAVIMRARSAKRRRAAHAAP